MFKPNAIQFKKWNCRLDISTYANNGRLAFMLLDNTDGTQVAMATVNLSDVQIRSDFVCIKNWSENEGILDALIDAGIIEPSHFQLHTGFVYADVCELTNDFKLWLEETNESEVIDKVIKRW